MNIKFLENRLTAEKTENDPKFYGVANAKGESNFLYFLKNNLNSMIQNGTLAILDRNNNPLPVKLSPFIKKRMCKDGHLVDDMQQYLVSKKPVTYNGKKYKICLFNNCWAVNGLEYWWNQGGCVIEVFWQEI